MKCFYLLSYFPYCFFPCASHNILFETPRGMIFQNNTTTSRITEQKMKKLLPLLTIRLLFFHLKYENVVQINIYFTTLTLNSTHMMQPLWIVYGPLTKQWRKILDNRIQGSGTWCAIPEPQFPMQLKRLMIALTPEISNNLQSYS